MKLLKMNKGITLVALVVTIIVLIILAGVSVSLVLGQGGIIEKAKQGRDNYAEAARIENEQIANVDAFTTNIESMIPSSIETIAGTISNLTDGDIEIAATVNLEGNVDLTKTKYVFTTSIDALGTNDESLYKDGTLEQATEEVKVTKKAGTYYLHVLATDINGNKTEIISNETATSNGKKDFDYTESEQAIILTPGNYQLEVWGAQGGNFAYLGYGSNTTKSGGKGGYSCGIYTVNDTSTLYVYVGGKGNSPTSFSGSINGGWNGGGGRTNYAGSTHCSTPQGQSGTGGGATDISTISSTVNLDSYYRYVRSQESYNSRIIVAGGGGGASCNADGNYGGGNTGGGNYPGTQTSAGITSLNNHYSNTQGCFVYPGGAGFGTSVDIGCASHECCAGGGGGYYGGGVDLNQSCPPGCGGSGFVSSTLDSASNLRGDQQFTSPTGANETGHSGNGYARITALD